MAAERWEPNSQITAEHLNAMIDDTTAAMSTAQNIASTANEARTIAQQASVDVTAYNNRITTAQNTANTAENKADNAQITANNAQTSASNAASSATLAQTAASNAYNATLAINNTLGDSDQLKKGYTNLVTRLSEIDNSIIATQAYTDNAIATRTVTATAINEVKERLDRVDGGQVDTTSTVADNNHAIRLANLENQVINNPTAGTSNIKSNVAALISEINSAHRAVEAGEPADTLQARFQDIEARLTSLDGNISNNNESLSAIVSAIRTEINNAHRAVEQGEPEDTLVARFTAIENSITSLLTATNTLDTRLDAIDGGTVLTGNSLVSRVTTVESDLNTSTTGIKDRLTAVETLAGNAATASTVSTLSGRVDALETKDTIVISTNDFEALDPATDDTVNTNADYIVGPDDNDKYMYYRFIQDSNEDWIPVLISGGIGEEGGGGTSSAIICASEALFNQISPKDENTDYYVLMEDNKYHHYRYYNNTIIEIGYIIDTSALTSTISTNVTSNINETLAPILNDIKDKNKRYRIDISNQEGESGTNYYLDLYEFGHNETIPENVDNYTVAQRINRILLPATGGGGGQAVTAKMILARRTSQNYYVLESANTIELSVFFSSYDSESDESYNGNYVLYRGSSIVETDEILTDRAHLTDAEGTHITKTFNIKPYCQPGVQTFRLVVTDSVGNMQTREWRVELVTLRVETSFNDQTTYTANQNRKISITPYGSGGVSKTIVVKVDNAISGDGYQTLTVTSSGIPQEITIPASVLDSGAHLLEIYVKQIIGTNAEPTPSESIYKDIICIDNTVDEPIIGSIYRRDENNTQDPIEVPQYTSLRIPYYVYDPTTNTPTVTIEKTFDNNTITVVENLQQNSNEYIFKGEQQGNYTITISCGESSIEIPIVVSALGYEINSVTDGLIFDFNPVGLSNSSSNRMWSNNIEGYENIQFEIPQGKTFDWYSGGYQIDDDNNTYFCIKAGSRMAIKASLFNKAFFNNADTGIEDNGANFKLIFKTTNVKQSNATFLTCQDNNQLNITTYGNDITDISTFKDYLTVVEIYDADNDTVLGICKSDNENVASIAATFDGNISTRTVTNNNLTGSTTTLVYENESLKRYQVIKANNEEACIYEEEYDSDHSGWLIKRIKPVTQITQTNLGLKMKAHEVNIISRSGILTTPYSEDDIIEFEYNINNKNNGSYILAYEDGVSTLPLLYYSVPGRDNFIHTDPGYIILGSDDCDLHIYRMKFYNKSLTNQQILMNFYADAPDGEEMVRRYERNTKLYDDPQSANGVLTEITPQSVANACPDLKIIMIEAPNLTGGKNSFIKNTKIRCIQKGGRPEDNWIAFNAYHSGQGTSSDNYGMSGRNLDIIFGFNGTDSVIAPSSKNNYSFDENYKSAIVTGVINDFDDIGNYQDVLTDIVSEYNNNHTETISIDNLTGINEIQGNSRHIYLNGTGKIGLSTTSVPNNWFNIKVNIASSENANNALLQKRYDRYLPYRNLVPAMKRDNKIKNDMEFYNCVIFIKETGTPTEFTNDTGVNRSWHFYGIGNIGDSKKTDNTRINIPGDPDEFCVEISDNGLANSGFSTGVYYSDEEQTITEYTETNYGMKYPISSAEWTNANNRAHNLLYDFSKKGGWEKSFEFRYDISTKDGNTIAESELAETLATSRQLTNKTVFADMYSWVVTATDEEFSNELQDWFIEDSPLYWYLFTERYTMIDSRAKNTFWHYGKIYITTNEYNGSNISTLESELEALEEGTVEYAVKQTQLNVANFIYNNRDSFTVDDAKAAIHNGYRFEMWDYDNDTALGINNNGKMVFNYGLEDTDKLANGSWVYNEPESVFWRRIRKLSTKLTTVYNKTNRDCWNAENLIEEFDAWQEQFPEELWRLDFERKYLRPYLTYNENKYLKDMANGRKKYQRRQFERDMAIYIYSKYNVNSAYEADDTIEFRTRAGSMNGLSLTVMPYGAMYINVMFGNTETVQIKASTGETITINPPTTFNNAENTQIIIYNASRIQEIGSLASWQLDTMKFSKAIKLQKLVLGAASPFINNYEQILTLANPILEELDIRNYTNMQLTLDLTRCQNLKILKAQGTNLQVVNFATGGLLEEAYLPSTITGIYLNSLKHLNTLFLEGYTNVNTIESLGSNYNIYDTVLSTLNYLTNINIDSIAWTNVAQVTMEKLYSITNSILKGIINMSGVVERGALNRYQTKWLPRDLTINASEIQEQIHVKFINAIPTAAENDVTNISYELLSNDILYETYINATPGEAVNIFGRDTIENDPASDPNFVLPTYQDARYNYTFGNQSLGVYNQFSGWYNTRRERIADYDTDTFTWTEYDQEIVYRAIYQASPREYTVSWYGASTTIPIATTRVRYGRAAIFPNNVEQPKIKTENNRNAVFLGWDTNTNKITQNTNVYSRWSDFSEFPVNLASQVSTAGTLTGLSIQDLYTYAQIAKNGTINSNICADLIADSQFDMYMGHDLTFNNVQEQTIFDVEHPRYFKYGGVGAAARYPYNDDDLEIKLFKNNTPFTLAIDFKFDTTNNNGALVSCFNRPDQNTGQGFQLLYNTTANTPIVTWGINSPSSSWNSNDTTVNTNNNAVKVGHAYNSTHSRNIVVLRYPADGTGKLYVYYDYDENNASNAYSDQPIKEFGLEWPAAQEAITNSSFADTTLKFGYAYQSGNTYSGSTGGTIYWAKIWYDDLGSDNCKKIASWIREKITMQLTGIYNESGNYITLPSENDKFKESGHANLQFTALNLLEGRGHSINNTILGWETNTLNTFLSSKFYNGIPDKWKSVIMNTLIPGSEVSLVAGPNYTTQAEINDQYSTNSYIYIPAIGERIGTYGNTYDKQNIIINNESKQVATKTVYRVISESGTLDSSTYIEDVQIKFKNFIIPDTATYYAIPDTGINAGTATKDPFDPENPNAIHRGDIWLRQTYRAPNYIDYTEILPEAYIFVNINDINTYHPLISYECRDTSNNLIGGWVSSEAWPTRTIKLDTQNGLGQGALGLDKRGSPMYESNRYISFASGICIGFSL